MVHFASLPKGSSSFRTFPIWNKVPTPNTRIITKFGGMQYQLASKNNGHVNAAPPSSSEHLSNRELHCLSSAEAIEREMQKALEFAREMDKKHGLCTEPSQQAWNVVDEIYRKMQPFQKENAPDQSKKVSMQPAKRNARRLTYDANVPKGIENTDMKGRKYFF